MKRQIILIVSFKLTLTAALAAQTTDAPRMQTHTDQTSAQQTQTRGYWVDPATGLMWAAKDNGKDLTWHKAVKYCRDLRLDDHSDWRLPALSELDGIKDKNAESPGLGGMPKKPISMYWHVKGNLFLTGQEWSSNLKVDDRRKPVWAWYFDFINLRAGDDDGNVGFWESYDKRALCVRQPQQALISPIIDR